MTITPQRPGDTTSANLSSNVRSSSSAPGSSDLPMPIPLGRLIRFLQRTAASEFFGRITVSFQNGRVGDIKIEQTLKPDEL